MLIVDKACYEIRSDMLRKKKDKERSEKKEKTEDEKAGGGKPNDDKKGFLVKSANAKAVRRILRDYVGNDEQKRRILEAELGNMPKDGKQRIVKVNRATAQADAFVTVRFNDTEIRATPVLLDSGAWICLFGKTFLRKLIQLGVLKKESELTESPVRYRVHGIHNHAVDTQPFHRGSSVHFYREGPCVCRRGEGDYCGRRGVLLSTRGEGGNRGTTGVWSQLSCYRNNSWSRTKER